VPDLYHQLVNAPLGSTIAGKLGLPQPETLRRYQPGQPVLEGPVLLGGAPGGRLGEALAQVLQGVGAEVRPGPGAGGGERFAALVFDATGIASSAELRALYDFFHPVARRLAPSGRVLVLGAPPEDGAAEHPRRAVAQRALEGFTRSLGKEVRHGATVNLVYVAEGGEQAMESTVRFFLSARSAYVSGQVVRVGSGATTEPADWEHPLDGKVALVTGAARGIGAAIAKVLARDGAHVICLDVPSQGADLDALSNRLEGSKLQLDITAAEAPQTLVEHVRERHGGLDIVVHNAGITRDKTLVGMDQRQWDQLLDVNLSAQERLDDALLDGDLLRQGGRIVSVSSMAGIAGNRGQTNYATAKAGIIGMVRALAPALAKRDITINAVAPGFIETAMTAAMPVATREAGRRMSSLAQGGQPVDVAETIAWLAGPGSGTVNGRVVRVCGQNLLGA
jgi:3-oxoacyl-[acyl-carrier protein] reductase